MDVFSEGEPVEPARGLILAALKSAQGAVSELQREIEAGYRVELAT